MPARQENIAQYMPAQNNLYFVSECTRPLFVCRTHLVGESKSMCVLACSRVFMEGIMEPERVSTPRDTRMSHACRTCQFITAVVYTSLDTKAAAGCCRTHLVREK